MSWAMSDSEILSMWRTCKNRNDQVQILADLNVKTRAEVLDKLRELGCDMRGVRTRKGGAPKKPPMDELRAMDLYREGLDDLAISEALGESMERVKNWRRRMKLGVIKKAEDRKTDCVEPEKEIAPARRSMDVCALKKVLERVCEGYDGDRVNVTADGEEISGVVVSVAYDCAGKVEQVNLELLTE